MILYVRMKYRYCTVLYRKWTFHFLRKWTVILQHSRTSSLERHIFIRGGIFAQSYQYRYLVRISMIEAEGRLHESQGSFVRFITRFI